MIIADKETGTTDAKDVGTFSTGRLYVKEHTDGSMTLEAYADDLDEWLPVKTYSKDTAETISPTHGKMRVVVSSGKYSVSIETA